MVSGLNGAVQDLLLRMFRVMRAVRALSRVAPTGEPAKLAARMEWECPRRRHGLMRICRVHTQSASCGVQVPAEGSAHLCLHGVLVLRKTRIGFKHPHDDGVRRRAAMQRQNLCIEHDGRLLTSGRRHVAVQFGVGFGLHKPVALIVLDEQTTGINGASGREPVLEVQNQCELAGVGGNRVEHRNPGQRSQMG